jgi:hypothetical protein
MLLGKLQISQNCELSIGIAALITHSFFILLYIGQSSASPEARQTHLQPKATRKIKENENSS